MYYPANKPFPSSPGSLLQNERRCSAFDTEIIFYSDANKTHFHRKGCAPSLILKERVLKLGSVLFTRERHPKGDVYRLYLHSKFTIFT